MDVWLQTRGVVQDYNFLGEKPSDFWWLEKAYKDFTSFEQPTLILERCGKEGQWRCFVSGLPSSRRDRVKTKISYTLLLSGRGEDRDKEVLSKILGNVFSSFKVDPASEDNQLTYVLDEGIGANADRWLEAGRKEAQDGVDEGLEAGRKEAQEYVKGLAGKFVDLPFFQICDKIDSAVQGFWDGSRGSVSAILLLNFVAGEGDQAAIELQEKLTPSQGKVLVLPSPVSGGDFFSCFDMSVSPVFSKKDCVMYNNRDFLNESCDDGNIQNWRDENRAGFYRPVESRLYADSSSGRSKKNNGRQKAKTFFGDVTKYFFRRDGEASKD